MNYGSESLGRLGLVGLRGLCPGMGPQGLPAASSHVPSHCHVSMAHGGLGLVQLTLKAGTEPLIWVFESGRSGLGRLHVLTETGKKLWNWSRLPYTTESCS